MWLGNGCVYKLNIDGEEKVFHSEQELDAFLFDHLDEFKIDKLNKTLSVDIQAGVLSKLDEIKLTVDSSMIEIVRSAEDPDEPEIIYKIPHSIGVTKFIEAHGLPGDWSKPINPKFDKKKWEENLRMSARKTGKSDTEIDQLIKEYEDILWTQLADIGTDIHSIFEAVFSDKEIPTLKILSKEQIENFKIQAESFKTGLIEKYGKGTKFLTEFAIKSKELASDMKVLLEKGGYNSINGRIDLIAIDPSGGIHLFDFKVSKKNFGDRDSWGIESNIQRERLNLVHSTKKRGAEYQLATYNAILHQYGLMAKDCNIVPISLDIDWDDADQSRIKTITHPDGSKSLSFRATRQATIYNIPGTRAGESYNNMSSILPAKFESSNEESIKIAQTLNELIPNANLETNVQRREVTIEYFQKHPEVIALKKITKDSPLYERGIRFSFKTFGLPKESWETATTEEELQRKLEKYVDDLNNVRTNELRTFADTIDDVLKKNLNWKNLADNFPEANKSFVLNQFKRYFEEGWDFVQDDNLNSLGFFIFRRNGVSEIVMLTNKHLLQTINLGMGTSLLGKTVANANVNSKEILDANYGNIELMKAMYYISEHPEMFKNYRIAEIRAINPWTDTNREAATINSNLIFNWNMLVSQNQDLNLKQIDENCFWDNVTGLLSIAYSKMENIDSEFLDFNLVPNAQDLTYNAQWIEQRINDLKRKYPELYNPELYAPESDVWQAYIYLNKALLASKGIYTLDEQSPGNMFTRAGINPNGLMVSAGQFSPSANMRILAQTHDQYVFEVRNKVYLLGQKFQGLIRAFLNEEKQGLTNDNIYESWFRKTSNGELDLRFLLKNPNSHDFDGKPKAKAALTEFINVMAKVRGFTDEQVQLMWDNDDELLFEVPLTEARFGQQVRRLNLKKALKNKWEQYQTLTQGVFAEDENKKGVSSVVQKLKGQSVYNKFRLDRDSRQQKLKEHGIGFFNMNLEEVFNQALLAYVREDLSKKYAPIFNAMRISLQHAEKYGKQTIDKLTTTFDKFINSKFYGEPIMDEDVRPAWRFLNVLKKGFSMMTLGLNFGSMFRELLQGTFVGLTRSGVKMIDGLDAKHYIQGAEHVIKEAHKNFSSVSLLQQLNAQYGMANMSLSNLAKQRSVNWFSIRNWNTDTLFLTSSSPDFQHRMAILVGKMMQDGSWEAHSLDENGVLKYDWKKDKRFEAYVNNKTDDPKYLEQKTLYLNYLREYNRIGFTKEDGSEFQEGDDLPMAYPPREQQTFKNFSDLLYGHYDDESKALLNDTFIGSFFLQYKTFVTAKLEQWTLEPGVYNTELLKQQYDPVNKDEKLYVKVEYKDGDNLGIPTRTIVRESQLTEEDKKSGNYEPYMRWEGAPMEGMWYGSAEFLKSLAKLDGKKLKEILNNPLKKSNLILALNDMILASLMMFIINALFGIGIGEEEWYRKAKTRQAMRDEGWGSQWFYKVAMGAFSDGPVTNIIYEMFSDVNPPLVSSITKLGKSTTEVIFGNKSIARAVTENVGAVREFQGIVRAWEED